MSNERERVLVPAGWYNAVVVSGGLAFTSENKAQVVLSLELADEAWKGTRKPWYGHFDNPEKDYSNTTSPTEITVKALRACGWKGDDLSDLSSVYGNEVRVKIEHEKFNGQTQDKVKVIARAGGLATNAPMSSDQAKDFAARMKSTIGAVSRSLGEPTAQAAPQQRAPQQQKKEPDPHPFAPGQGDDEVPF